MLSHLIETRTGKDAQGPPRDPVLAEWLGAGAVSASGQPVTVKTALGASAVYACVRNTADTIASLPCVLKRVARDEAGRRRSEEAAGHPLHEVLLRKPNGWQTPFEFWRMLIWHVQLRGNHYSRIVRNGAGQTVGLEPFVPDQVRPFWSGGLPAYEYHPLAGKREILLSGEVFHVRGPLIGEGLLGASPIELHRETFGMALAARDYGARFFANDARPSVVLKHPGVLDDSGQQNLKASWRKNYGGPERHGVAVLEEGMDVATLGMTNADAQWLELRGMTDLEISRLFRTPPHKIGIKTQMTLNNIEHQNREWVTDTLMPLAHSVEDAIARDLLTSSGRRTLLARFDFAELLRGDIKTRTEANAKGIQWGWYSPNDVREREGQNPIGPEGDVYVSPVNMQPMMSLLEAMKGGGAEEAGAKPEDDDDEG